MKLQVENSMRSQMTRCSQTRHTTYIHIKLSLDYVYRIYMKQKRISCLGLGSTPKMSRHMCTNIPKSKNPKSESLLVPSISERTIQPVLMNTSLKNGKKKKLYNIQETSHHNHRKLLRTRRGSYIQGLTEKSFDEHGRRGWMEGGYGTQNLDGQAVAQSQPDGQAPRLTNIRLSPLFSLGLRFLVFKVKKPN